MSVSTALADIMNVLVSYEVKDIILPFLLIFTIIFAVLQKVNLFGSDKKNIHVVLALLISVLAVVPHVTKQYGEYDPIKIINALIPSAAVLAVTIVLILFLFGIFGSKFTEGGTPGWAIILVLAVLVYIFGTTIGWWSQPGDVFGDWWDSDLTTLMIVIMVFGVIVYWITGDSTKPSGFKQVWDELMRKH